MDVFYPYVEQDELLAARLANYLRILVRQGILTDWWDRLVNVDESSSRIDENFDRSRLVLPLVSANFLAAPYVHGLEMQRALERHQRGEARLAPILVEPVDLRGSAFDSLLLLPLDGRPVSAWPEVDSALANIAAGIKRLVNELIPGASFGLSAAVPMPDTTRGTVRSLPRTWNVPYSRNPHFVARDAVLQGVHNGFATAGANIQVVYGRAGTGKTSVAVEYAYRYASDYRIAWWIRGEHRATMASDYAGLAWRFELPERELADQEAVVRAVHRLLADRSDWLLIFDNVGIPSDVERLNLPRNGHILVTSRAGAWDDSIPTWRLEELSPEDAVELFENRIGRPDHASSRLLVDVLGSLPLTLAQAAAYINASDLSVASHTQALKDANRKLEATGPEIPTGRVEASADAPVNVEIEGLAPPYIVRRAMGTLAETVPPGPYRVRFTLGPEVVSEADFFVVAGELVILRPGTPSAVATEDAEPSNLSPDLGLAGPEEVPGPGRSMLEMALPLVGIPLADRSNARVPNGSDVALSAADSERPVAVLIAIDGDGWPASPTTVRDAIRVRLATSRGDPINGPDAMLGGAPGFQRFGVARVSAPGASFALLVASPHFGTIALMSASAAKQYTVVTLRVHANGRLQVGQCIVPVLGEADQDGPGKPYRELVRRIELGQQLYSSGDLIAGAVHDDARGLRELFSGEWTDPILSCMACFSMSDALMTARRDPLTRAAGISPRSLRHVATNAYRRFGDLPDCRVVYALTHPSDAPDIVGALVERDEVPVLARGASFVASWAGDSDRRSDAAVYRWTSSLLADQPWTIKWDVDAAP